MGGLMSSPELGWPCLPLTRKLPGLDRHPWEVRALFVSPPPDSHRLLFIGQEGRCHPPHIPEGTSFRHWGQQGWAGAST